MSVENETVPVRVYFGFQITRVSDVDGELVTTTYEPGEEVELEAEIAREEEHRNRVRIIRPEPVIEAAPPEAEAGATAEVADAAAAEASAEEVSPAAPVES